MMRDEVRRFAEVMERELRANDHKGGWKDCSLGWLLSEMLMHKRNLQTKAHELMASYERIHGKPSEDTELQAQILDDAADVANFAMMIADICGALPVEVKA